MALTAPQYAITPNYCLSGFYRGYRGDSADGAGVTKLQMASAATFLGWTPEVVMVGGGINGSSLTGLAQHIVYHVRGYPKPSSGGTPGTTSVGSLHLGATSPSTSIVPDGTGKTYTQYWQGTADSIIASPFNTAQLTVAPMWEGSGGGGWGGLRDNGGIDPATGVSNSPTDFANFFHNMITTMRARGMSSAVTVDWNVFTNGMTAAQMLAMYPGDDVVDIVGWDCYSSNYQSAAFVDKTNYDFLWLGGTNPQGGGTVRGQKTDFDTVTNFARGRGKRAGAGEFGEIALPVGSSKLGTSSDFTIADTDKYFKYVAQYVTANADVWAYLSLFNENQHTSFGYNGEFDMTEDDQLMYFGTDPATQSYLRMYSTNNAGTDYLTVSPQHTLSAPAWKTWFKSGTLQLASSVTPVVGPYQVVTQRPRFMSYLAG